MTDDVAVLVDQFTYERKRFFEEIVERSKDDAICVECQPSRHGMTIKRLKEGALGRVKEYGNGELRESQRNLRSINAGHHPVLNAKGRAAEEAPLSDPAVTTGHNPERDKK